MPNTFTTQELQYPCILATETRCYYCANTPASEALYIEFGKYNGTPIYIDSNQVGENFRVKLYYLENGNLEYRRVNSETAYKLQREGITYLAADGETGIDMYLTMEAYYSATDQGMINSTRDRGYVFADASDLFTAEDGTMFYDSDERDYYDERERNNPNNFRTSYHNGANNVQYLRFGIKTPQYLIGLEIEKEDIDILRSIQINDFHTNCPKWRKEADGSLNHDSGFELISPVMELDPEMIAGHIEANPILSNHVNAEYSDNCGMHANLSDPTRTPLELFDDLYGYLPVLCALYPTRANNTFCKAMPKHTATQNNAKYQALTVKSDRVEIRIFPAVTTTENLKFRLQLLQFMMQHPAPNAKLIDQEAMLPLFESVHRTESQRASFAERFAKYVNILRA
jgi:hypothetical protein